jgi:hypothetical protein
MQECMSVLMGLWELRQSKTCLHFNNLKIFYQITIASEVTKFSNKQMEHSIIPRETISKFMNTRTSGSSFSFYKDALKHKRIVRFSKRASFFNGNI